METGVIKFKAIRRGSSPTDFFYLDELNRCRERLISAGLLGRDENGIGFGNMSVRESGGGSFHVTASGAGDRVCLSAADIVQVSAWDFANNQVDFTGSSEPSSESLTHAAVYEADHNVQAVIHAHDRRLWQHLLDAGDATLGSAEYGTPAMADEVKKFVSDHEGRPLLFSMTGHEGGLLSCGANLEEACAQLLVARR